jgi:hypothetical protein
MHMGVSMTSITSVGQQHTSPLQRLQSELSSEVQSGSISQDDESTLNTALETIDDAMQSQAQSDRSSGTRPSASDMKSKLDDLISSQVDSGSLTSSQADELKQLFASAMPDKDGAGGPPPSAGSDDTDSSSSSSTSSSSTDLQSVLEDFMKSLQDTLDESSSSYGADGRKSSVSAALLVNYQS